MINFFSTAGVACAGVSDVLGQIQFYINYLTLCDNTTNGKCSLGKSGKTTQLQRPNF